MSEVWKDLWRSSGLTPLSGQVGYLCKDTSCRFSRTMSRQLLEISKRETPQTLRSTCASAPSPSQQKSVLWCLEGTSCVSVGAYCLLSWHWTPLKRPWLCPLCTFPSFISRQWLNPPELPLLCAEQSQLSQLLCVWEMFQSLNHRYGPMLDPV